MHMLGTQSRAFDYATQSAGDEHHRQTALQDFMMRSPKSRLVKIGEFRLKRSLLGARILGITSITYRIGDWPTRGATRQPQTIRHGGDEAERLGVPQHVVPSNSLASECEND